MNKIKVLTTIAIAVCITGCAGVHLYDQASLDLAIKTQSTFTNANLTTGLAGERKLMDSIAAQEQTVVRRQTLALRNTAINEVVGQTNALASWKKLENDIDARIAALTKLDTNGRAALFQNLNDLKTAQGTLDNDALIYQSECHQGDPDLPSSCTDAAAMKAVRSKLATNALLQGIFDQWSNQCSIVNGFNQQIANLYNSNESGLIGQATKELTDLQVAQSAWNAEYATRKKAFDDAKKAYDAAATNSGDIMAAASTLSNAVSKLDMKDAVVVSSGLEKLGFNGLGLEGALAQVGEEQSAVMDAIAYLNPTNTEAKPPTNSSTFLTLLPVIKAEGSKIGRPPILHLYLVQEHLQIQANEIQNQINSAQTEYNLKVKKRALLTRELMLLNHARLLCTSVATQSLPSDKLLAQWVVSSTPEISRPAVEALADYASAWTTGRVQEELVDYQIIDARHTAALDSSDSALQVWNNLIGTPLQQLIAFYGSGIKPETIANLIEAAGISTAVAAK